MGIIILMQWIMNSHVHYYHKKIKLQDISRLNNIRNSVNRQVPLGNEKWQIETATKYGMLSTLNERGRPRKDM